MRKGHWVTGLGPTVQRLTKELDGWASEGTRARCNATFKENTALLIPGQFGFSGTFQEPDQCSFVYSMHLSRAGKAGTELSLSVHLLLPDRECSPSHWRKASWLP